MPLRNVSNIQKQFLCGEQSSIEKMFGAKMGQLLYRASLHGFENCRFHSRCDRKVFVTSIQFI